MVRNLSQCFIIVFLVSCVTPRAVAEVYGSGWYGEFQASFGYEDNIARTYKSDTVSDQTASVSIGGGHARKLGKSAQLILSGYLTFTQHDEYVDIDNYSISLGLDYTFQPNASYSASWYNIRLSASDLNYRDSDPREGIFWLADVSANKRLAPGLLWHAGYRYKDLMFSGKSSAEEEADAAFDTSSHEIYVGVDYQFRSAAFIFAEYAFRDGDIVSTISGGRAKNNQGKYDAITMDPVFDAPCSGLCPPGYAYRNEGETNLWTLGVSFPVEVVNVDFTANYFDASSDNGRDYEDWLIRLGMIWTF